MRREFDRESLWLRVYPQRTGQLVGKSSYQTKADSLGDIFFDIHQQRCAVVADRQRYRVPIGAVHFGEGGFLHRFLSIGKLVVSANPTHLQRRATKSVQLHTEPRCLL